MIPNLRENNNNMKNLRKYLEERNYEQLKKFLETTKLNLIDAALSKASNQELEIIVNIFPNLAHVSMLNAFSQKLRDNIISVIYEDNLKKVLEVSSNDELFLMSSLVDRESKKKILDILPTNRCGMLHIKYKHISDGIGHLCSMNYVIIPAYWSVSKTLEYLANNATLKKDPIVLIINEKIEVIGYVPLSKLLVSDSNSQMFNIMFPIPTRINVNEPIKHISDYFEKNDINFALVEDDYLKPVGIITTKELIHSSNNECFCCGTSLIEKCAKIFPYYVIFGILGLISFFITQCCFESVKSISIILMILLVPMPNTLSFVFQNKFQNKCLSFKETAIVSIENFICSSIMSFLISASCIYKLGLTACVTIFITTILSVIILILINLVSTLLLNFSQTTDRDIMSYSHIAFSILVQVLIIIPVLNLIHSIIFSKVLI